jgi:dihydroxy-acid dehydratase
MADVDAAGDIPAVLHRLRGPIKDSATVGVLSIADLAAGGDIRNHEVIRSREDAYHAEGGITALKGNIAHSATIKQTVVDSDMLAHTGPAKVYHSGKALLDADRRHQRRRLQAGCPDYRRPFFGSHRRSLYRACREAGI